MALFTGTVGLQGEGFLSLLDSILAPKHTFSFQAEALGPGVPHAGPYDKELYALLDAKSVPARQSFTAGEFTPPSAVAMLVTVVPSETAPVGSSPDFPSGPIIPNQQFAISIDGSLYRNGSLYDSAFPMTVPGYDRFVPPIHVDGASHFFVPFGVNSSFAPDLPPSGSYQYTIVMLDAMGAGWGIRVPFTVAGGAGSDGGADTGGGGVQVCTGSPPASALITNFSDAVGNPVTFGTTSGILGGTYTYVAPGLAPPALSLTTVGDGGTGRALRVVANPGTPTRELNGYFGVGLYFQSCIDASAYNGIKFTIAGDLGSCSINFAPVFSEDLKYSDDPTKGSCTLDNCYSPSVQLTSTGTKSIRFEDLVGGSPGIIDPAAIAGVQWQMNAPGGHSCTADFTITDLSFVTDAPPPICPVSIRPMPPITGSGAFLPGGGRPFTFGAPNLAAPTVYTVSSVSGELQALEVTADPGTTTDPMKASVGFGMDLGGGFACIDASPYAGIKFTAAGDLGACKLTFSATPRQDLSVDDGGACTATMCFPPQSAPIGTGTTTVRFSDMTGGSPYPTVDAAALSALQWTLTVPIGADAGACKASLRISDIAFVSN